MRRAREPTAACTVCWRDFSRIDVLVSTTGPWLHSRNPSVATSGRSARIATKYARPSSLRSCRSHAGMSRSAIRRWPIESSIAWSTTPIGLRCAGTRCGKVAESRTPEPKLTTGPKPVRSRRSCHCSALHELGFKPQTVTKYARPDFVPRHLINDLEPGS